MTRPRNKGRGGNGYGRGGGHQAGNAGPPGSQSQFQAARDFFVPRYRQDAKAASRGGHGQPQAIQAGNRKVFQSSSGARREAQIAKRRREPVTFVPEVNLRPM